MIRLSELVSALSPTHFAQLALILFMAVFVAVAIRHGGKRRAAEHAQCAQLPLADDAGQAGLVRSMTRGDAGERK